MIPHRQRIFQFSLVAGLSGLLTCLLLTVLTGDSWWPRPASADSVVSDCPNQAQLQAALNNGGLITFQCPSNSTIQIATTLTATKSATIDGFNAGNSVVLDGLGARRIISVSGNTVLTLTNITLQNGNALDGRGGGAVRVAAGSTLVAANALFRNNKGGSAFGGAVYGLPGSSVVISGSQVLSNTAPLGGGIYADLATVTGSQIVSNTATLTSGGMFALTATVMGSSIFSNTSAVDIGGIGAVWATISGSVVLNNQADRWGGGMYVGAGATVTNSEFTNNRVLTTVLAFGKGGGVYSNGTLAVAGSTFLNNTVRRDGGGAFVAGAMTVTASTFVSNTAGETGGGIRTLTATITGSTFVRNTAGYGGGIHAENSATVADSSFANNSGFDGGAMFANRAAVSGSSFVSNTADYGGGIEAALSATVVGSSFMSNTAGIFGGGLYAGNGVTVTASSFLSNTARDDGGGIYAGSNVNVAGASFVRNAVVRDGGNGGGIFSGQHASIDSSTFLSNSVKRQGGGAFAVNALTVTASSFLGNAGQIGGGAFAGDDAFVSGSRFINNSAQLGGGFHSQGASVFSSEFLSNTASNEGGGFKADGAVSVSGTSFLSNTASNTGGGFVAQGGTVINVTLAYNQAGTLAGAIAHRSSLTLTNTTVANNSAPALAGTVPTKTLRLRESIVTGPLPLCKNLTTTFAGNNINRDPSGCGAGGSNVDPLLGPAQDNGGGTMTLALLPGSPAIGTTSPCATVVDQRGLPRVAPCDIGAYETGIAPSISSLLPDSANAFGPGFTLTVNGTGFISGTVALWNGAARATTVLNSTTLAVTIPATDLQTAGLAQVQARYGLAPDSVSNALPFTVRAPRTLVPAAVKGYSGGW